MENDKQELLEHIEDLLIKAACELQEDPGFTEEDFEWQAHNVCPDIEEDDFKAFGEFMHRNLLPPE